MKKILKWIFPIVWLKRVFVLYNSIKIHTLDKLIYRSYKPGQGELILARQKNPFLELGIDLSTFPEMIKEGFHRWTNPQWMQDEYIVRVNKTFRIDPVTGWAVVKTNELIYPSLGFSHAPYVRKPRITTMLRSKNTVDLKKIISLRDTGEENYFHFFNDILPKIWLLQDQGIFDSEAYIVISKRLWEKDYFNYYLEHTVFKKLNWYVQNDEWIKADVGFFCKPFTHSKKYLLRATGIVIEGVKSKNIKRIFLTRSQSSKRFIENNDTIKSILEKHGFVTVDTGQLTFIEQLELFSSVEELVTVHGAGTVNIIFRNQRPLRIVEIFHPNNYLPFHYIMLCKLFNYEYLPIQGRNGMKKYAGGFYVDSVEIEKYCLTLAD